MEIKMKIELEKERWLEMRADLAEELAELVFLLGDESDKLYDLQENLSEYHDDRSFSCKLKVDVWASSLMRRLGLCIGDKHEN
jgi:hypothetical protein